MTRYTHILKEPAAALDVADGVRTSPLAPENEEVYFYL